MKYLKGADLKDGDCHELWAMRATCALPHSVYKYKTTQNAFVGDERDMHIYNYKITSHRWCTVHCT